MADKETSIVETPQTDATHVDTSKANASKAEAKNTGSDLQQYLTKLLENETSPESLAIKNLILKRIALEGDVKPARIPAPLNITQIGGYINLMEQLNLTKLQERTLTSILGLPVQYDEADFSKDLEIATLRQELAELKKEIASLKVKSEEQ